MTDTKKTHIIVKSIHSALRSEFKNEIIFTFHFFKFKNKYEISLAKILLFI